MIKLWELELLLVHMDILSFKVDMNLDVQPFLVTPNLFIVNGEALVNGNIYLTSGDIRRIIKIHKESNCNIEGIIESMQTEKSNEHTAIINKCCDKRSITSY